VSHILVIVDAFSYPARESFVVVVGQKLLEQGGVSLGLWAHPKVLHVLGGLLGDPLALVVVGPGPFQFFFEVGSVPFQGNVVDVGNQLGLLLVLYAPVAMTMVPSDEDSDTDCPDRSFA